MALKSIPESVYVIGAKIKVYDLADMARPVEKWEGTVVKVNKKMVTLRSPLGHEFRFHRVTGYIVGFAWPQYATAIRPQTS
jgi:hypothetical protein